MPFVAGGSWDCCVELENPQRGAAAVEASGGCSGEAWLEMPVCDHQPLLQLHLVVVAPGPVHLVLAAAVVLWVLHLDLGDHPWGSAASASDAGAFAGVLLLVTRSWGSLAVGPSVLADPVVLLAAAGDLQRFHH